MRYIPFTILIYALAAICGCKGSHKENSPIIAQTLRFDETDGDDSYYYYEDDEEDSATNVSTAEDSIGTAAPTAEAAADTASGADTAVSAQPIAQAKPSEVTARNEADDEEKPIGTFDGVVHRMKVHPVGRSLREVFNDSNAVHLEAAHRLGFAPITDLHTAYAINKPIRMIRTCDDYHIDKLRHSMPYLVPEAEMLLHEIGRSFSDTIRARGGKKYKIKVTSLTRTDVTVRRLRRHNGNATQESAHRFGTTFDISYAKFICCDSSYVVHEGDLKNILAEVLFRLRNEGRCYVKYERKQGCFHITTRPRY